MSDRNINGTKLMVIVDQFGIYPSGCSKWMECKNLQAIGDFKVVTDAYIESDPCGGIIDAGTVYPIDYVTPATTVDVVKVNNGALGFAYVTKTSYDAAILECNSCCNSEPQLAQPASFVATPGDTQVSLDWGNVTNATGYTVERSANSDFSSPTVIYSGATSAYVNTGLTNGTNYYYRVKATAPGYDDSPWAYVNATPVAP